MKRCPECRRDYYDETLLYCLDDGSSLLEGPAISEPPALDHPTRHKTSGEDPGAGGQFGDEPKTAILQSTAAPDESPTERTVVLPRGTEAERRKNMSDSTEKQSFSANRAAKPLAALVVIVLILVGGFFGYRYFSPAKQIESIAVMPFVNDSGNADVEYLSDGMTETLISSLSQLENLSVKPRSSVFRYKGAVKDAQEIGKELGVQAVLNGRVVQHGEELLLFVELVDVLQDKVVWSRQYNRKQSQLVDLQAEISRDVSARLKPKLSQADEAHITKRYTTNTDAYQHYLKGNYYRLKWTEEGYKKAIDEYNKAIELDPTFGLAYTGLATAHMVSLDWFLPPNEAGPRAKAAALKAIEMDESLSDAHVARGLVALWYEWDWKTAEKEAKRAIELDPNNGAAHQLYGWYFNCLRDFDRAITEMKTAQQLEPLSPDIIGDLANVQVQAGQLDEGMEQVRKGMELDRNVWYQHEVLGLAYERKGLFSNALDEMKIARELNDSPIITAYLGYVLAVAGKRDEALQIADQLNETSKRRHVSPYYLAAVYSGLNDANKAFELLDKAYEKRCGLANLSSEIIFDHIRHDPRYSAMLKRMNLPE